MKLLDLIKNMHPDLTEATAKLVEGSLKVAGCEKINNTEKLKKIVATAVAHQKEIDSRYNPLEIGKKQSEVSIAEIIDKCPICSQQMAPVTLIGGVEATYCNIHNVVYPKVGEPT